MFRSGSSQFDKLLDKATSNLLMDTDWPTIMQLCDLVRQDDVQPRNVLQALKKKLFSANPHTAMYSLQVLESLVKNCGNIFHRELTQKINCEMLHELAKTTTHENVRTKLLELIQAWTFAFRKNSEHNNLRETMTLMKAEGYKFPTLRESDAMFTADSAPEWADGEVCHRCRTQFGIMNRKHHCRNCGQVFCHQCSQKNVALPKFGIEKEVRVCDACYDQITKPTLTLKKSGVKSEDNDLPAEYLSSSLAQQSQLPARKTEEELREEEELQLALALSQSEAEAKEKEKYRTTTIVHSTPKNENRPVERSPTPPEEPVNPELARYLNRSYWENRQTAEVLDTSIRPTSPSAPAPAPIIQNNDIKYQENGLTDIELNDFINTLKSQVEIFINRMKSNSSRGRSIANDSSVQTLFLNITAMHSQLLRYIQQHDDSRLYYEGLQDKLNQVKDARAALDALRDEHHEKLRRQAEEAERQRQLQMAHKLEIMRKKKQDYLQYQRQLALQRVQEEERGMQMRQEQQKQQYLMGSSYVTFQGSPVHGQFPMNNPQQVPYRTYPYGMMGPQSALPVGPPTAHPQMQGPPSLPPGMPPPPGLTQGPQSLGPLAHSAASGMPQQSLSQPNLSQLHGSQGLPQGMPIQGLPSQLGSQSLPGQTVPQGIPQPLPLQHQGLPPGHPMSTQGQTMMHVPPSGIPPPQYQQPGAPPASPQITQSQQTNSDAQTAELISFD